MIGSVTIIFAGLTAAYQYDLKKIIAYSTCSQLGYMMLMCGLSYYALALFHLINHAFFKALLFLCAGIIIHIFDDEQDIRRLTRSGIIIPVTETCFLIGTLAITGFPFLTGFYSKDLMIDYMYIRYFLDGSFTYTVGLLGTVLTAVYSFRL